MSTEKEEASLLLGVRDLVVYLAYFVFVHTKLLFICSVVVTLNVWLALRLNRWKTTKPDSRKSIGFKNTTGNCSNRRRDRPVSNDGPIFRSQFPLTATEPLTSTPTDETRSSLQYHTPQLSLVDPVGLSDNEDSDETLNEITWAFDSSPSIYRSHHTADAEQRTRNAADKKTSPAKPNRAEVKQRTTRDKPREKKKVSRKQIENHRVSQVRRELHNQARVRTSSAIPRPNQPSVKPRTTKKTAPTQLSKRSGRPFCKKTKVKEQQSASVPVSTNPGAPPMSAKVPVDDSHHVINGGEVNVHGVESNVVCKKDSWIWFSRETRPSVENFATRQVKFQSCDPRVMQLAEEIKRQERLNQDIERNARSLLESSSLTSDPAPLFNLSDVWRDPWCQPQEGHVTNLKPNLDLKLPETFDFKFQTPAKAASRAVASREIRKLFNEKCVKTNDYFKSGATPVPTTLCSPLRLTKNSLPNRCTPKEVNLDCSHPSVRYGSNSNKQSFGMTETRNTTQENPVTNLVGTKHDVNKLTEKSGSPGSGQKRFWPRSMSANVSSHVFQSSPESCCNHAAPTTNNRTLNLALDVSPSPSRQNGRFKKSRAEEMSFVSLSGTHPGTNAPISGPLEVTNAPLSAAENSTYGPSTYGASTGDSETDSNLPRTVKRNNPRIESVIKREVNCIVSNLFKSPAMSSSSYTQPSPLVSTSNNAADSCTSYVSEKKRSFVEEKQASQAEVSNCVSNQACSANTDRTGSDERSRFVSRIPLSVTGSSPTLTVSSVPASQVNSKCLPVSLDLSSSLDSRSKSQPCLKRVNIYSPEYYLGKRKSVGGHTEKSLSCPTREHNQAVKEVGPSQRQGLRRKHIYNVPSRSDGDTEHYSNSQNAENLSDTKRLDRGKVSDDLSSRKIHRKLCPNVSFKSLNDTQSPIFEPSPEIVGRCRYNSVGSNNSSNYPPSKQYTGLRVQNKERQFRRLPYERTLYQSKDESPKLLLHKSNEVTVCAGRSSPKQVSPLTCPVDTQLKQLDDLINKPSQNMNDRNFENHSEKNEGCPNRPTTRFSGKKSFEIVEDNFGDVEEHLEEVSIERFGNECEKSESFGDVDRNETHVLCETHKEKTSLLALEVLEKAEPIQPANQDSGYDSVSMEISASQNGSLLCTHEEVDSNLNTTDMVCSLDPSPSQSESGCHSSPELAEFNRLSSEDNDSAQDTLPPSMSDDNSLWSWDHRCCVDKLPEVEHSLPPSEPLSGVTNELQSKSKENVSEGEIVDVNLSKFCPSEGKSRDPVDQPSLTGDVTITTTQEDSRSLCLSSHVREEDDKRKSVTSSTSRDLPDLECSSKEIDTSETNKNTNLGSDNECLDLSQADNNQSKLDRDILPNNCDHSETASSLNHNAPNVSSTNGSRLEIKPTSRGIYSDSEDLNISLTSFLSSEDCNGKNKLSCADITLSDILPSGTTSRTSLVSSASKGSVKNWYEVERLNSSTSLYESSFSYSNLSLFNRCQELTGKPEKEKKEKIITKRGVPFSELLKRF